MPTEFPSLHKFLTFDLFENSAGTELYFCLQIWEGIKNTASQENQG